MNKKNKKQNINKRENFMENDKAVKKDNHAVFFFL